MLKSRFLAAASVFIFIFSATLVRATGFSISSPTEYSSVQGSVVTVKFSLPENYHFSPSQVHTRPVYGQGHVHLWLDTQNFSPSSAIHVNSDTYVFENVKYGSHTLTAEWIANNDAHSNPPLISSVSFTTLPVPSRAKNSTTRYLVQTFFLISILAITTLYLVSRRSPVKTKTKSAKKKSKK